VIPLAKLAGNPVSEAENPVENLLQSDNIESGPMLVQPFRDIVGVNAGLVKQFDTLSLFHRDLGQKVWEFGSLAAMGIDTNALKRGFGQAESAGLFKGGGAAVVPNINCFGSHQLFPL
jgi:hypothetical protein